MEQGQVEALRDRSSQGGAVALPWLSVACSGLCPGLGGGCSQESDVEWPRGAARGRASCGQRGEDGAVPIARTKPESQSRTVPPQQVGRTRAGARAQWAAGAPRTLGVRVETFCWR